MLARYINLRHAVERRESLEAEVKRLGAGTWTLERFEAVTTQDPLCRATAGRLRDGEKACFLSHRNLLTQALQEGQQHPFMVWEDDVLPGPLAHSLVRRFLEQAASQNWDLVYTDVIVPDLASMLVLLQRSRLLRSQGATELLDLAKMNFAGSSAYVVNPTALEKVVTLLHQPVSLDEPLDLYLRRLIHQGALRAWVLFPFVTTLSDGSLNSNVQLDNTSGTDLAWTLFRRLIWANRDIEDLYPLCNQLASQHPDPESSILGVITAALLSPQFRPK